METLKVRVFVEYQERKILVKLKTVLKGKEMLQKILRKLDMDVENWENFTLEMKNFEYRIARAKDLVQDDILTLKEQASENIIFQKEGEGSSEIQGKSLENLILGDWSYNSSLSENQDEYSEDSIITDVSYNSTLSEQVREDLGVLDNKEEEEKEEEEVKVDVEKLKKENWSNREELSSSLKTWASDNHMKLGLDSQERVNKDDTKITIFYCSSKKKLGCKFFLKFRTKQNKYVLHKNYNIHNHKLSKYHSASAITPQIFNRIKSLKPVTLDSGALTEAINKEFKTNFDRRTIYHQMKKATQEEIGKPNDDAQNFVKMFKRRQMKKMDFMLL